MDYQEHLYVYYSITYFFASLLISSISNCIVNKIIMSQNLGEIQQAHPKKWRQVVQSVQNANLDKLNQIQWQSKIRQKVYCSELDRQVTQHNKTKRQKQSQKQKERVVLTQQIKRQNQAKLNQHIRKMKTQQKYGQQNIKLINNPQKHRRYANQSPEEHPFIKLVDKQQERKHQTIMKFQFQNHLNTIQSQIKRESKRKQKQLQKQERRLFQEHVQEQFQKKAQDRQNFKKKYLKVQKYPYPSSHLRTQSTIDKTARRQNEYLSYLQDQAHDQKLYRRREQQLDQKMINIHKHVKEADSSPAYLGRNIQSTDRRKQFQYIDKSLNLDKYSDLISRQTAANKVSQKYQYVKLNQLSQSLKKNQHMLPILPKRRQTQFSNFDQNLYRAQDKANVSACNTSPTQNISIQKSQKNKIGEQLEPSRINQIMRTQHKQLKSPTLRSLSTIAQPVSDKKSIIQNNKTIGQPKENMAIKQKERRESIKSDAESLKSRSFFRYDFISGVSRSYVL